MDDGAADLETALEMARIAVGDGITRLACTPHITPGLYENNAHVILPAVERLREALEKAAIPLELTAGADIHVAPDLIQSLKTGRAPTLAGGRYFLLEPPHHVLPPGMVGYCQAILAAGFRPILTHPERLSWIENHYDIICSLDEVGVLIQLTAGSITGRFGDRAQYWSRRMLLEGRVDLIASDGHNVKGRPPRMDSARRLVGELLDPPSAEAMTITVPQLIWQDGVVPAKPARRTAGNAPPAKRRGMLSWLGTR